MYIEISYATASDPKTFPGKDGKPDFHTVTITDSSGRKDTTYQLVSSEISFENLQPRTPYQIKMEAIPQLKQGQYAAIRFDVETIELQAWAIRPPQAKPEPAK